MIEPRHFEREICNDLEGEWIWYPAGNVIVWQEAHVTQQNCVWRKNLDAWSAKHLAQKIMVKRPFTGDRGLPESPPPLPSLDVFASFPVASTPKKTQGSALSQREPGSVRIGGSYKVAISGGPKQNFRFKNPSLSIWLWKVHPRLIRTISRCSPPKNIICHFFCQGIQRVCRQWDAVAEKVTIICHLKKCAGVLLLNTGGFGRCWPLFENPFIKKQSPQKTQRLFNRNPYNSLL